MDEPRPTASPTAAPLRPSPAKRERCAVCGRRGIDVVHIYELTTCGNAKCQLLALQAQQSRARRSSSTSSRPSRDEGAPRRARLDLVAGALRRQRALGSWARGALLLDAVVLSAAVVAVELGPREAGTELVWPGWLLGYADLQILLLTCWAAVRYFARPE